MRQRYLSFFLSFLLALFCLPEAQAASVHGVLRVVKGKVQVKSARTQKTARARVGMKVHPQDAIITGEDSRAKIVMIDGNEINVSPDSEVMFEKYEYKPGENKKDVLLNVIYGKVRSKVEQKYDGKSSKFQVKTPSAVAGVRGTDFLTSYDVGTKESNIVTFEGQVEFGTPGANGQINNPVAVGVGQTASAFAGKAPTPPAPVPQGQLAAMDSDTDAEKAPEPKSEPRAPADEGNKKKEPAKDEPKSEEKPPAKQEAKPEAKQEAKPEPKPTPKTANQNAAGPKPAARTPAAVAPSSSPRESTGGSLGPPPTPGSGGIVEAPPKIEGVPDISVTVPEVGLPTDVAVPVDLIRETVESGNTSKVTITIGQ